MNLDHHIIRRKSDFNCTDKNSWTIFDVHQPPGTVMEKVFGGKKEPYYVANGNLEKSINLQVDVEGILDHSTRNRLEIHLQDCDHPIYLRPQITVLGVAPSSEGRSQQILLNWLLPDYDDQRSAIRGKVYNLIHRALGVPADARTLDSILSGRSTESPVFATLATTSSQSGRTIQAAVAEDMGLVIAWKLALEDDLTNWIAKLKAQLPAMHTAVFNADSRTGQFRLSYSVKVLNVRPSRWHLAQTRMKETGGSLISVESEIKNVHRLIHQTLDHPFSVFGGHEKMWEHPRFWALIDYVLQTLVGPRIEREFGYEVEFADFKRERTPAEMDAMGILEGSERLAREFNAAEQEYLDHSKKLSQHRLTYAAKNSEEIDAARAALELSVSEARTRRDQAQKAMETTSYGNASDLSTISIAGFAETFSRFFEMLQMTPPQHLINFGTDLRQRQEPFSTRPGDPAPPQS